MSSDLWFEASRDVEAETADRELTHAKVASVGVWPFLAVSESDEEFEMRLEYAMPRLSSVAAPEVLDALLASLREDWTILRESRDFPEGATSPRTAAWGTDNSGWGQTPTDHLRGVERTPECPGSGQPGSPAGEGRVGCPHCDTTMGESQNGWGGTVPRHANMVNTSPEDEAAAEANSEPEGDLDHVAASLTLLRITTATSEGYVIVDSASGRKIGPVFKSRPEAEQAIAAGRGKGRTVKIIQAAEWAKRTKKKASGGEPPPF